MGVCVCVNWIINDSFELCEFLDTTQQNCHRPAYGNSKVEDHQCAGTCSLGKYVGNDGRSDRGVASLPDTDQGTQQHKQPEILHTHTCTHTHTHAHTHARTHAHARTHTHTHLFNSPFSGTTRVSRYQKGKTNLDFTEARDSEWQWHQLGHMQVCTSLQTDR